MAIAGLCVLVCGGSLPGWGSASTTTTLTATSGGKAVTTSPSGIAVTLTATVVAGSTAVTPGQVEFCDATAKYCTDIHLLGVAQLTSAGTATLKFMPGVGSHSYKAVFLGTTGNAPSSSNASALTVAGTGSYPTMTSIAQSGSAGNYTLTATVSGNEGILPTGTVSFLDAANANYVLGTESLTLDSSVPSLSFTSPEFFRTDESPASIAVGDFNNDGLLDMAVANETGNTVTILLGAGNGTFAQAPNSPVTVGSDPAFVVMGDFNGDGIEDLAVTEVGDGTVTILLGHGDGTFQQATGSPVATGNDPLSAAVGDFNGDGNLDLTVANHEDGTATILLGNGNGTFRQAVNSPVNVGISPKSVIIADFNGDGIPDLAVANDYPANTVAILLGNGNGTFTESPDSPIPVGQSPESIAVGDFNGDGFADLATVNDVDATVTILLGSGNGPFTQAASSPVKVGYGPESIVVGDFNGDGIPDLATANSDDSTSTILLGNGNGTFVREPDSPEIGGNASAVAVGDFNGDGLADLAGVLGHFYYAVTVFLAQVTEVATATTSNIAVVGSGTHQVQVSYPGDTNYAASVSGTTGLTAEPVATTPSLTTNPSSTGLGQQVVLTATLTPGTAQNHSVSGAVMFLNGTTSVGSGTLSGGVATLNLTSLPAGTDSLTATYAGDTNFTGSTSPAVTETVIVPDYSITANPTSLTIPQGGSGTVAFTISPVGGFSQSMTLACSGLPANSICTFSPATVTPTGSPVTFTLTIATNVNSQAATLAQPPKTGWLALALPIGPAGFAGFLGLLGVRSRNRKDGKWMFTNMLLVLGAVTLAIAVAGCGGGGSQATTPTGPVTPTGTSTVTVTASTAASGGPSHSSTLTLIIAN
ncbi:FG-GAP-like repeat-containing protein [Acidicapsa acidisoli]|nr:FG-GAP-like repeat-containing protein [Acidicapsa acidisoli]